jgi:hypothetical protein
MLKTKVSAYFDLIQLPFNVFDNRLIVKGHLKKLIAKSIEIHARSVFLQGITLFSREIILVIIW